MKTRKDIEKAIADFWGEMPCTATCLTVEGILYELRGMEKAGGLVDWPLVDRILGL